MFHTCSVAGVEVIDRIHALNTAKQDHSLTLITDNIHLCTNHNVAHGER